jgi:hypothetical protein
MRRELVVAGLACALVLAGCDTGGGSKHATESGRTSTTRRGSSTSRSTTTSLPDSSSSAPSVTSICHFNGSTSELRNGLSTATELLSDVSTATAPCQDTITFTFLPSAAPQPSYDIDYTDGPFTDSAGRPVKPPGTAYLRVRFSPAWIADMSQPSAPLIYTGPKVIAATGSKVVRGLALYAAEEGVVGWIVGIDGTHPIDVDASPGRVVVAVSNS